MKFTDIRNTCELMVRNSSLPINIFSKGPALLMPVHLTLRVNKKILELYMHLFSDRPEGFQVDLASWVAPFHLQKKERKMFSLLANY